MPKQKTNKTMSKRIKITGTGKILRRKASRAHKLTLKSGSRKRAYTLEHGMAKGDSKNAKKMVGVK
ncbi:50S ribosomal protein L35 [Candidatus Saccharibacteria bacterium]|nr:50S ribosomal protein L35 [Candidatus Saccharibacteria bacterium]